MSYDDKIKEYCLLSTESKYKVGEDLINSVMQDEEVTCHGIKRKMVDKILDVSIKCARIQKIFSINNNDENVQEISTSNTDENELN